MTQRFYGPSVMFIKTVRCTGCDKRLRRQRTISHTVNPFNRNADGTVKSWSEVEADVIEKGRLWELELETCQNCRDE